MITDKLKKNIDQSVDILRRYHHNAVERNNVNAKTDIEIVMTTVQDLSRLVFNDKTESLYKEMLETLISICKSDEYDYPEDMQRTGVHELIEKATGKTWKELIEELE